VISHSIGGIDLPPPPHTNGSEDGKATLETTILANPTPDTVAPVFTCKVRACVKLC
jgi:hypothetical protein